MAVAYDPHVPDGLHENPRSVGEELLGLVAVTAHVVSPQEGGL